MISRPARYSAAVAGSSGCAGGWLAVSPGRTAVSVMADLPGSRVRPGGGCGSATGPEGLFVGDDRADPVAYGGVAPDQPDGVEDGHHDDTQGGEREPVVRLGLRRLAQVVDGHGDGDHAEHRQDDVLDDAELVRPELPVEERQGPVGPEVDDQDPVRPRWGGLGE